ncbi:MAG TPA: tyrosine-type recombinase/integrase [Candidatus Acidoferrales bacterium]|nr:tyrosine-type recombinase/integrase [Candidatus Acidoferrales bacterium]
MRTRHQNGWVEERKGRVKRWYGHYFVYSTDEHGKEVRRHVGVALGEKASMRKWQAEATLRKLIETASKAQPHPNTITLMWFINERFLPMRKGLWAASTTETNLYTIEKHILPTLGDRLLTSLSKFDCQVFLNGLAEKNFSHTVVDHSRTMLKAVLEEAVEADLLGKNPARKIHNPETKEALKPVMAKNDSRRLLEALPFRDQLIAMIAAFCAMRPGEIFGLRWSSWRGEDLHIEGTAWRGTLRPGKAKTKNSKAPVAVPDVILPLLEEWRKQNANAPAEALLFPTEQGTPMRPENWLRRRVKPIAAALGITVPVNFQVLRRTFATNASGLAANAKDVQVHLRHTDIGTTFNNYTQPVAESTRKLVNAVALDVMTSEPLTESVQ